MNGQPTLTTVCSYLNLSNLREDTIRKDLYPPWATNQPTSFHSSCQLLSSSLMLLLSSLPLLLIHSTAEWVSICSNQILCNVFFNTWLKFTNTVVQTSPKSLSHWRSEMLSLSIAFDSPRMWLVVRKSGGTQSNGEVHWTARDHLPRYPPLSVVRGFFLEGQVSSCFAVFVVRNFDSQKWHLFEIWGTTEWN